MKKYILIILTLILAAALRLVSLDKFPAGLNADEAAIGYNAWSLIQTGKDEHSTIWPLVFRSFDDYKPPIYFYLVLPFVKFLGLNVWSVRLPSALLGIASVYLIYLIVKQLVVPGFTKNPSLKFKSPKPRVIPDLIGNPSGKSSWTAEIFPLLSALILATSPWHLQFSRGGWEVNAALFFILLGIWSFFKGIESTASESKNAKYFYLFVISFAVSLYTYHSARIISPLLALTLVILYWPELTSTLVIPGLTRNPSGKSKISSLRISSILELKQSLLSSVGKTFKTFLTACLLGVVLSLPLAGQLLSKEGQSRFTGVSVFSDTGPLWQALEMRRAHTPETIFVKAVHNQYLSYGLRFVKNYLSHFSPRFLFVTGDEIARSKVPGMGQTYLLLIPFYFLGLFSLLKLDSKGKIFIFIWFLIAPLAAALTFQSPHALRSQNMVIPLTLISALGLSVFLKLVSRINLKPILPLVSSILLILGGYSVARYFHLYYVHYPKELSYAWQYGFDQIAIYAKANYDKYDRIVISDRYDQPYILMAFFLKYPPESLQKEMVMTPRDKFGFSTLRKFGKFEFRSIDYGQDKKLTNTLIIAADEAIDNEDVIYSIYDPAGHPMYKFISTSR